MKCEDCGSALCRYRDVERNCFYESHPDYHLPDDFFDPPKYIDWQNVKIQAAIAAMQGVMNFFGSIDYNRDTIAELAVAQADALIKELRKEK